MEEALRFTLIADGSSDEILLQPIDWLLRSICSRPAVGEWANPFLVPKTGTRSLEDRVSRLLRLYPCDLLLVHRDAESVDREQRLIEVENACARIADSQPICGVVPVRMSEAWFLFDELAIRTAADNPNGAVHLEIPQISRVEELADPKDVLHSLIRRASELSGRRLEKLRIPQRVRRLADLIDDYSPLRAVSAFSDFESRLRSIVSDRGW